MVNISIQSAKGKPVSDETLKEALKKSIEGRKLKKILILPPDMTRIHSYAGKITALYYSLLKDTCQVDIMPALGTHEAMTREECLEFFGDGIPYESIKYHNWRDDVVKIGEIPSDFVSEISGGLIDYPIDVEINKRLLDDSYDLIISVGQVVPHEVAGMANYTKNILVGCGGKNMIDRTHFLGAVYGMERMMGRDHSPVRKVFDYAEANFINNLPLMYVLTVTTVNNNDVNLEGLFIGRNRKLFEEAVLLSQQKNLIFLDKPLKKVVVYLDEREFKSTWLGNKAVYRTRMAIADDGELIVLAPGVRKFGEDNAIDKLIRKYGYSGRINILKQYKENDDLKESLSAAAHIIHGSSDGRFSITYATEKLSREEIMGVGFKYMPLSEAMDMYNPAKLKDGFNKLDNGEEIFYISNPAIGLWANKTIFDQVGSQMK
jgi:nickel-dependent lactate racemase